MPDATFTALLLEQTDGTTQVSIQEVRRDSLPPDPVLVRVAYSSLNYKDGLAITGRGRVVRMFPMVPGIDLAGTVEESSSPDWKRGDEVIATGWGMGENHWGGYGQQARVPAEWLVRVPQRLDLQSSMALGTAGLTAMLSVMALEEHGIMPDSGQVVVTGAAGGVGSVAVALLAQSGYTVIASTGRAELRPYLEELGASSVIDRDVLSAVSSRPLEAGRWAGAIDNVGGSTLAGLLRTMKQAGAVASCGNAGGIELSTTVLPFILRGVTLLGIDSNYCAIERRRVAWDRLAHNLPADFVNRMTQVVSLHDVPKLASEILAGKIRGRTVVEVG